MEIMYLYEQKTGFADETIHTRLYINVLSKCSILVIINQFLPLFAITN